MDTLKQIHAQIIKRYKVQTLVVAFVLFWTPVVVFSKLAGEIVERKPIGFDVTILQWIHMQSTTFYDSFFLIITTIGNVEILLPFTLLVLAYFIYKKHYLNTLIVLFSVGGAAAANIVLKLLFQRDRPSFWQSAITETGYSFPSGHAMLSSALILSIMFITWQTRWRWPVIIVGSIMIGLIGLSRLYLGVHYPTDIIAGWSVSFVWVLIVCVIASRIARKLHQKV